MLRSAPWWFCLLALLPMAASAADEFDPVYRAAPGANIAMQVLGRFDGGLFSSSLANTPPAYDSETKRLFAISNLRAAVEVFDLSNPADPERIDRIDALDLPPGIDVTRIGGIRSVAFSRGVLAVALSDREPDAPGIVIFFNADGQAIGGPVQVGVWPNMMAFTPDGRTIVLVNSGMADDGVDPEGSISLIRVGPRDRTPLQASVTNLSFRRFNARRDALVAAGVRIYTPGSTVAQDFEPESVAISPDGQRAYVTLERNNTLAEVDLLLRRIIALRPLGTRNLNRPGNGIDASDADGRINIRPWPVLGYYQPDGIAAYRAQDRTFLVMANEGDPREFEDARVGDLPLDLTVFPNAVRLQRDDNLGRLRVTNVEGDTDGDGDFDRLFTLGTRSFSIRATGGQLVFDSGDAFERITAAAVPEAFNTPDDETEFDGTSDARGPEPEQVTVGRIGGRDYAFIVLERIGGVMVYDITRPSAPRFQIYINNRNFDVDPDEVCVDNRPKSPACAAAGDLGPESVLFIPATRSPIRAPLVIVAHETSDSITIFRIDPAQR